MGGSGFIGKTLIQTLISRGHTITILTRAIKQASSLRHGVVFFEGNPTHPGPWQEELRTHDAVINLAGASIFRRWTKKAKKTILESRVLTTRNIAAALTEGKDRVAHFLKRMRFWTSRLRRAMIFSPTS
jgi:NAD dependent epimerase/dehydratase family enzyme